MAHNHDRAARLLARQEGAVYNSKRSPDIRGRERRVEVKSYAFEIAKALEQLGEGRSRRRYVCLPKSEHASALEKLRGSGVGIIDRRGNIVKRARRST